jgi:hypothetical protein
MGGGDQPQIERLQRGYRLGNDALGKRARDR